MTYKICKNCGECVEEIKEVTWEFGNEVIKTKCPKCGYTETISKSHVHYGNDAIKK